MSQHPNDSQTQEPARVAWIELPNGVWQTRTLHRGKVYLGEPVPYAFAVKMAARQGIALRPRTINREV